MPLLYYLNRLGYERRTQVLVMIEVLWEEYNIVNEKEVRRWGRNW